jgi:hypothetical protein
MPWFPDFVGAVELARRQTRTALLPGAQRTRRRAPGRRRTARLLRRAVQRGRGIGLQHCAVTDDGMRCAVESNFIRWGSHDLPPQAGIGVYERGPGGLLAASRIYDDVQAPGGPSRGPAE